MVTSSSVIPGDRSVVTAEPAVRQNARLAGAGLLVALASIALLYGGTGALAGTRPDDAERAGDVVNFFNHPALVVFFTQAIVSALALAFFSLAFRRYVGAFAPSLLATHILEFGVVVVLLELPVLVVGWGFELALVRLSGLADPSVLGIFMAWDWIDNGAMLWLEVVWVGALSLTAWMSGALPRWLAGLGLVVSGLLMVFAAPALALRYPAGTTFVAYVPFMAWMLVTGFHLVRGGAARQRS